MIYYKSCTIEKKTHYFIAISMKCIPALPKPTGIELKKVHLQLLHWNAPLTFQSFMAACMNPNGVQYEMRGPIMKYKNRNKHTLPWPRPVEYSPLFSFSAFALTSAWLAFKLYNFSRFLTAKVVDVVLCSTRALNSFTNFIFLFEI